MRLDIGDQIQEIRYRRLDIRDQIYEDQIYEISYTRLDI